MEVIVGNEVFNPIVSLHLVEYQKIKAQPQCIISGGAPSLAWSLIVKSSNVLHYNEFETVWIYFMYMFHSHHNYKSFDRFRIVSHH